MSIVRCSARDIIRTSDVLKIDTIMELNFQINFILSYFQQSYRSLKIKSLLLKKYLKVSSNLLWIYCRFTPL